jgi:hypothetical protein
MKMIRKITLLAVVICLLLTVLCPISFPIIAQSSGQITISNSTAQMDFPLRLNFASEIRSNAKIADIRLRYQIDQISSAQVISESYVPFSPSNFVAAKYSLDMRKLGGLPPGSNIDYWWVATDVSGTRLESKPIKYQITITVINGAIYSKARLIYFGIRGMILLLRP